MNKTLVILLLTIFSIAEVSAKTNQTGYRWRYDDGNETTATWKAAEGQATILNGTEPIRLRIQAAVPSSYSGPFSEAINLYYSKGSYGSTWKKIFTDPANAFVLYDSPHLPDLSPTSRQLSTQPELFQAGEFFGATFDHSISIPLGAYSEYEWAFRATENAGQDVYFFSLGYDGPLEGSVVLIEGVDETTAARLYYNPGPAIIPLKNWSVYLSLVLLAGFVLIRYRRLL